MSNTAREIETWREVLVEAASAPARGYKRRAEVLRAAYDAGLTQEQIAKLTGLSHTTVQSIVGGRAR